MQAVDDLLSVDNNPEKLTKAIATLRRVREASRRVRSKISEKAGGGRKSIEIDETALVAAALADPDWIAEDLARQFGVSVMTIRRRLAAHGIARDRGRPRLSLKNDGAN